MLADVRRHMFMVYVWRLVAVVVVIVDVVAVVVVLVAVVVVLVCATHLP